MLPNSAVSSKELRNYGWARITLITRKKVASFTRDLFDFDSDGVSQQQSWRRDVKSWVRIDLNGKRTHKFTLTAALYHVVNSRAPIVGVFFLLQRLPCHVQINKFTMYHSLKTLANTREVINFGRVKLSTGGKKANSS